MDREGIKSKIIGLLTKAIEPLEEVYIFGSFVNKDSSGYNDIDIAFRSNLPLAPVAIFDIQEALASLLNIDIDLVDLNKASLLFQTQIVYYGERIYARDEQASEVFASTVFCKYITYKEDIKPITDAILASGTIYE